MAIVSTIIGALLGFAAAIFVEPIKRWLYRPKLVASFGDSAEFQTQTKERQILKDPTDPTKQIIMDHTANYIRVKIINTKSMLAKGCRAYLTKIEKRNKDGNFSDTIYCDSIPLAWSCRDNQRFQPLDLPIGVNQFIDLVSMREFSDSFHIELQIHPYRYESLYQEKGYFRFTIQISGENVKPVFIKVDFVWDGSWDTYICKQVQS
jgi:hypothetical protein